MKQAKITYEALGDTLLIHMPKELDHHNCRDLKRDTDLMLDENYINRIIFDFGKTEFMDSSGIGVLLNRYKQMAAAEGLLLITEQAREWSVSLKWAGWCV